MYLCIIGHHFMQMIGVRTKHGPGVHGPPLWTRSMDHFYGLGPCSPCHGPGPRTVFFNFYKKVLPGPWTLNNAPINVMPAGGGGGGGGGGRAQGGDFNFLKKF